MSRVDSNKKQHFKLDNKKQSHRNCDGRLGIDWRRRPHGRTCRLRAECCAARRRPAPCGEDGLDGADGLARVSHQEGDVAQFGHGGQKLEILGQARLVLEDAQIGVVAGQAGHHHGRRRGSHIVHLDVDVN